MAVSKEEIDDNAAIDGFEPSYVDVDGIETRYYDVGSGDPLVLIHGGNWAGLSSANTWTAVLDQLGEEFRVLAFDRVGCGMTEAPDDPSDFRYETDIDHALGFINEMNLDYCHLGGFSRGGGLGARLAVEEPELFESLVIVNSATLGPAAGDSNYRHERIFQMEDLGFEKTEPGYVREWYKQYSYQTDYITDKRCETAAYMEQRESARRISELMHEEGHQEKWQETLDKHMNETHQRIKQGVLDMPTLYIYGRDDLTVPPEMSLAAFDMIGQENENVRMKMINKSGHMVFLEHPEEFAQSIIDFIKFWS